MDKSPSSAAYFEMINLLAMPETLNTRGEVDKKATRLLNQVQPLAAASSADSSLWNNLLNYCTIPNQTDTVLLRIYRLGLLETAKSLYDKNLFDRTAYAHCNDQRRKNLLHIATESGNVHLIRHVAWIVKGDLPQLLRQSDATSRIPYQYAIEKNNPLVMTLFTEMYRTSMGEDPPIFTTRPSFSAVPQSAPWTVENIDPPTKIKFQHLVDDFQFASSREPRQPNAVPAAETEFSLEATSIGNELNNTHKRIADLQKLVRQRGIFDDRTIEIQGITYEVRQSIIKLSGHIDVLARTVPISTATTHDVAHFRSVLQALRARLADVTMELKSILEQRAAVMKSQEDRRSIYSYNPGMSTRRQVSSLDDQFNDGDLESGSLLTTIGGQRTQVTAAPKQSMYHAARVEAVESVQKMIGELAQMFNRVATLVRTQEELTVRIEDDMSSSLHNLEQSEAQLLKYFRSISSNRSLILKVFAVLMLFVVFFVVFLT